MPSSRFVIGVAGVAIAAVLIIIYIESSTPAPSPVQQAGAPPPIGSIVGTRPASTTSTVPRATTVPPPTWTPFTTPGGSIRLDLPGAPGTVDGLLRPEPSTTYRVDISQGRFELTTGATNPTSTTSTTSTPAADTVAYDRAVEALRKAFNARVDVNESTTVQDRPARRVRMLSSALGFGVVEGYVFTNHGQLVMIDYATAANQPYDPALLDRMMSSLQLT